MRLAVLLMALVGCRQQVNWLPDKPWPVVPVSVQWSTIDPIYDRSIKDALRAWNHAAGCTVLEQAGDWLAANVAMSAYDGTACGQDAKLETFPGAVAGTWRCSVAYAEVKFQAMSDIRSAYVTAAHELGHVLGLDHDRSLIMRAAPPTFDPANGQNMDVLPWVSDADGAAVGLRYCNR